MCMIQNNYGNNKHSSSEGIHGTKKRWNLNYTNFCDNLSFIFCLYEMYVFYYVFKISPY
jgi:hypothetical protein